MPRYNLNHQDVQTIVSGLFHLSINTQSSQEHTRITNLRDRLLAKLTPLEDEEEIDVWSVFSGKE
jgi:predicted amino acid-binding ACT domain protein